MTVSDAHVSLPPVEERLRMALAEVGYHPDVFDAALTDEPVCRLCFTGAAATPTGTRSRAILHDCRAVRRFELDCGARTETER